jgi:outer membrane protein
MGLKAAQAGFWVARSKFYQSEQKLLADTVESYLDVYAEKEKFNIAIDSLTFAKRNFDMAQEKMKVGEATVTEVALASANLARAEAAKSGQYSKLVSAHAEFRTATGMEPDDDVAFPSIPENLPDSFEKLDALVKKSNLELLSAKYTMLQAKHGLKAAAGGLLPDANIKLAAEKDFFRPEAASGSRKNTMSYSTSLVVSIPIFSKGGVEYSNIREKKKSSRQAVYGMDYKEKQVKSQVISIWEAYLATKDSIVFVDKAVEAQALALDGVQQQYSVGSATMLDVLKSQEDLNQAKTQAVDTRKNYILTAYRLKSLMGQLTASQLKLNTKYFNPEQEFRSVKHKIIGF